MFAQRRQRFLDAMGPDAVALFVGARPSARSNDTEYPFRQDSDLWYLTGFAHPCAVALLRTDGGPPFTLFVQAREPSAETWTGYRPGVEGAKADFGADEARPCDRLAKELPEIIKSAKRIYHVLGRDPNLDQVLITTLENMRLQSRLGVTPASEIVDPRSIVHEMRLFKSEDEIALLRRASEISREAHAAAARLAHGGTPEYVLEATLDYSFRRLGAAGPAYTTIVGGGRNATTLHYVTNNADLRDGDLVLIDAGAELEGYASDVTRTYPVGGRFEGPQRAVYEVVLAAQESALAQAKPGATLDLIHSAALHPLVEGMVELGLLAGDVDALIASEAYKPYYMHRTSHWLGLDVHDVGSYTQPGGEGPGTPRPLEAGMVFTVEPGIYIGADDERADQALRGIGVRIEDDVVITPGGHENLNASLAKQIDDVEALVRAG